MILIMMTKWWLNMIRFGSVIWRSSSIVLHVTRECQEERVNCRLMPSMALDFGDSSAFTVHRGYFFIRLVFIECLDEYLATVIAHPFERICSTRACPLRIKTVSGTRSREGRLARARVRAKWGPLLRAPTRSLATREARRGRRVPVAFSERYS